MLTDEQIVDCAAGAMYAITALVRDDVKAGELSKAFDAFARAVEQAAYERAAQECEKRAGPIEIYNRAYSNFMDCAAAIRALMAKEQPK